MTSWNILANMFPLAAAAHSYFIFYKRQNNNCPKHPPATAHLFSCPKHTNGNLITPDPSELHDLAVQQKALGLLQPQQWNSLCCLITFGKGTKNNILHVGAKNVIYGSFLSVIHLASLLKQCLLQESYVSVVIEMTNLLFNLHFQAYRAETSKACLTEKISSQKGMQWFNTFHSPKGAQLLKWAKSDSNASIY